jgi:small nuclear ribonucleoprotein (snRNP)-like protein
MYRKLRNVEISCLPFMNVVLDTVCEQQEPHLLQGDHVDVSGLMLLALNVFETRMVLCYQH